MLPKETVTSCDPPVWWEAVIVLPPGSAACLQRLEVVNEYGRLAAGQIIDRLLEPAVHPGFDLLDGVAFLLANSKNGGDLLRTDGTGFRWSTMGLDRGRRDGDWRRGW